ncbi:similar to Saccharomyces cerevisiae YBR087W RFC5 Subunit of heteropentameric Replication factor C (RF-C) [Geotrichum candidum]|uniref:Replication factor C subunit 5 n=1 Tax=Geotrichum candidum TaxID=1173061 RepID=A0A0J9X814_GEOCN|nr:similar to Saccharomyces cerevisiae YBR087W RFC5 Subunit of heteropentameric Replication factor C (RF-C) [Geotrichum candidum]
MSLWVDKYRPKSLAQLDYHHDLSTQLDALASSGDFPHMLVYGPSGAGKKTRVMSVLKKLYGPGAEKIKINARVFQVSSSKKVEFTLVSSIYHIEITPSDMGNNDRVVIQDLLKEIAQTQQVDVGAKQRFKTVVINEADMLTRDAQSALRRTMEKYSPNLRLILLANSTSNIIGPIKSRTLLVRVAAPSIADISQILEKVAKKEHISMPRDQEERDLIYQRIAVASDRNLRKALLIFEAMYSQNSTITTSTPISPPDWELVIGKIADSIIKKRNVETLLAIRSMLYDLIAHCIPPTVILKTLTFNLLSKVSNEIGPDLIEKSAFYDHRLRQGSKAIFHLEAMIANYMQILEKFNSN